MRVRVLRRTVVITGRGGEDTRLSLHQVADVPDEVVKRHPDWFEVVNVGAPKPVTTQVQKEEAVTSPPKPKTRRRKRK